MGVHVAQLTGRDCGPCGKQLNLSSRVLLLEGEVEASALILLTWLVLGPAGGRAATLLLMIGWARSVAKIHGGVMISELFKSLIGNFSMHVASCVVVQAVRSYLVPIVSFKRRVNREALDPHTALRYKR
jgi:hypothetical protein